MTLSLREYIISKLYYLLLNALLVISSELKLILLGSFVFDREDMRRWRERQLRVIAWSVNKPVEKKYFSKVLKVTYMTDTMIGEPDKTGDIIIDENHDG